MIDIETIEVMSGCFSVVWVIGVSLMVVASYIELRHIRKDLEIIRLVCDRQSP